MLGGEGGQAAGRRPNARERGVGWVYAPGRRPLCCLQFLFSANRFHTQGFSYARSKNFRVKSATASPRRCLYSPLPDGRISPISGGSTREIADAAVDMLTTVPQDPRRAKLEGGKPFRWSRASSRPATSPPPSPSWPRASGPASATRCCSASPAPARPSPPPRSSRRTQRPAIVLAPNKTLAAQLYGEFKGFFPENAVEYFVSYYDYYQPEAYVAAHRHLHREGKPDQRADRPDAPLGDPGAAGARRRHHRRLGFLHLRHRLGRDLRRDDPGPRHRPAPTTSAR